MPVQYETQGHVGIVTLSRPEARNAWGADLTQGIEHYFNHMEDDDDIRCAVLTGDAKPEHIRFRHPTPGICRDARLRADVCVPISCGPV